MTPCRDPHVFVDAVREQHDGPNRFYIDGVETRYTGREAPERLSPTRRIKCGGMSTDIPTYFSGIVILFEAFSDERRWADSAGDSCGDTDRTERRVASRRFRTHDQGLISLLETR